MTAAPKDRPLRLGLPKGRVMNDSRRACRALGVDPRPGVLRYTTKVAGRAVSVHFLKIHDIARLLASGHLDIGVTGDEWLMESAVAPEQRVLQTGSYHARLSLLTCRGNDSPLSALGLVATPYPLLANRLLVSMAPNASVVAVTGSTEALVPDVVEAALDVVESGASAAANGLVVRADFGHVTTHLVRSMWCPPDVAEEVGAMVMPARSTPS